MEKKILIIDGHPVYTEKIIAFLQGMNFKNIRLALTGQQGLRDARRSFPDLVILSGQLPDMDSQDVCKQIKQIGQSKVRIIIQVGLLTEKEEIDVFKEQGADVVLDRKEKDLVPLQKALEACCQ